MVQYRSILKCLERVEGNNAVVIEYRCTYDNYVTTSAPTHRVMWRGPGPALRKLIKRILHHSAIQFAIPINYQVVF